MKTIIGLYLVAIFVTMRCAYSVANKLIKIGAVAGIFLLAEPFRTEISAILVIVALLFILKTLIAGNIKG